MPSHGIGPCSSVSTAITTVGPYGIASSARCVSSGSPRTIAAASNALVATTACRAVTCSAFPSRV